MDDSNILPCSGKLAFDTRSQAEGAAAFVHYQYGTKPHIYHCRHCHLWHLSSQPE